MEEVNRLCHGFVIVPILAALRDQDFFKFIQSQPVLSIPMLGSKFKKKKLNPGPFFASLRMLVSMGWLAFSENENEWTPRTNVFLSSMIFPTPVLEQVFEADLSTSEGVKVFRSTLEILKSLTSNGIEKSANQSLFLNPDDVKNFEQLLLGVLLVPLLIHAKQILGDDEILNFLNQPESDNDFQGLLEEIFINQKWIEETVVFVRSDQPSSWQWTPTGKFVWERVLHVGVVASYRPLLSHSPSLLFQNFEDESRNHVLSSLYSVNKPIVGTQIEEETHVDRTLNVLGSGSQHEKYFIDMQEVFFF